MLTKPNDHSDDGRFWRFSKPIEFHFMFVRALGTSEHDITWGPKPESALNVTFPASCISVNYEPNVARPLVWSLLLNWLKDQKHIFMSAPSKYQASRQTVAFQNVPLRSLCSLLPAELPRLPRGDCMAGPKSQSPIVMLLGASSTSQTERIWS